MRQTPVCPRTKPAIAASISRDQRAHGLAVRAAASSCRRSRPSGASRRADRTRRPASRRASEKTRPAPARPTTASAGTPASQPAPCLTRSPIVLLASPAPTSWRSHGQSALAHQRLQPRHIARQLVDEAHRAGSPAPARSAGPAATKASTTTPTITSAANRPVDARGARAGWPADRADRRAPCRRRTAAGSRSGARAAATTTTKVASQNAQLPLEAHRDLRA